MKAAKYTLFFKQGTNMTLNQCYELSCDQGTMIQEVGIMICDNAMALKVMAEKSHKNQTHGDFAEAWERALAIWFIEGMNPSHIEEYITHLHNCHLIGNDFYSMMLI